MEVKKKNILKPILLAVLIIALLAATVGLLAVAQLKAGNERIEAGGENLLNATVYALLKNEHQRLVVESMTESEWQARANCIADILSFDIDETTDEEIAIYEEEARLAIDYDEALVLFMTDEDGKIFLSTDRSFYNKKFDAEKFYPGVNCDVYSKECVQMEGCTLYIICDRDIIEDNISAVTGMENCFRSAVIGEETAFSFAVDKDSGNFCYFNNGSKNMTGASYTASGLPESILTENDVDSCMIYDETYSVKSRDFESDQYGNLRVCVAYKTNQRGYLQLINWTVLIAILAAVLICSFCLFMRKEGEKDNGRRRRLVMQLICMVMIVSAFVTFLAQTLDSLSFTTGELSANLDLLSESLTNDAEAFELQNEYLFDTVLSTGETMSEVFEAVCGDLQGWDEIRHTYYDDVSEYVREPITDLYGHPLQSLEQSDPLTILSEAYMDADIQVINRDGNCIASSGRDWYYRLINEDETTQKTIYDVIDGKSSSYIQLTYSEDGISDGMIVVVPTTLYTQDIDGETVYCFPEDYEMSTENVDAQDAVMLIKLSDSRLSLESLELREEIIVKQYEMIQDCDIELYADEEQYEHISTYGVLNKFGTESGGRCFNYKDILADRGKVVEVCVPTASIFSTRGIMTAISVIVTFAGLLIIGLVMSGLKPCDNTALQAEENSDDRHAGVVYKPWKLRNAREKTKTMFKVLMLAAVVALGIEIIALSRNSDSNSVIYYLFSGEWERGVNFYSVFALGTGIFSALSVYLIVSEIMALFSSRSEAYKQIRFSMAKTMLGAVLFCIVILVALYFFGMDIKGMFASAGIMAAIIGYASKDSISEYLSTALLIYDDKVRIGEVVTIGGFTGVIDNIGFKNTKLRNFGGDIKYISNSSFKDFVNTSREESSASISLSLDVNQDPAYIEKTITDAIPEISARISGLTGPIIYLGITSQSSGAMTVVICANCKEMNKSAVGRKMYKEFITLLQEKGIKFSVV